MRKLLMTSAAVVALTAASMSTTPLWAASDTQPAAGKAAQSGDAAGQPMQAQKPEGAGTGDASSAVAARYRSLQSAEPGSIELPEGIGTEEVVGAAVYDANAEHIGEVVDLLLDDEGQVTNVLVDVGGFLGMGEHRVALDLEQVEIARADGELRVVANLTQEQLEAMPAFERDQAGYWTERTTPVAATSPRPLEPQEAAVAESEREETTGRYRSWDQVGDTDMTVLGNLTAKEVIGAPVYDANAEHIGEVADILIGADNKVERLLVDVGGFLGMGEHRVALNLDQVQLVEVDGEQRLSVAMTEEELEAMPAFERDQAGYWLSR